MSNQVHDPAAQAAGTANGTNGSAGGFGNQLDSAFNTTNGASRTNGATNGNTILGAKNPVLTGVY